MKTVDVKAAIRRYKAGEAICRIARELHVGNGRLSNAMKAAGCQIKSTNEAEYAPSQEMIRRETLKIRGLRKVPNEKPPQA